MPSTCMVVLCGMVYIYYYAYISIIVLKAALIYTCDCIKMENKRRFWNRKKLYIEVKCLPFHRALNPILGSNQASTS